MSDPSLAMKALLSGFVAMVLLQAAPAWGFDLSHVSVPREEILSGGPPKDGIPALSDPEVVAADSAGYLRANDRVIGVTVGRYERAYPIRILNWHEVVNDQLGGIPIVVTYCPLCGTGIVFSAGRKDNRALFGVSGLLYNSDVLLYDRGTESLWSQLKMEAISGARLGERLRALPSQHTTWQAWRLCHPRTDVLSIQTGYKRDYDRNPYLGYETSRATWFSVENIDNRLHPKAWVLGVVSEDLAKAYPFERLAGVKALDDKLGDNVLRIHYDSKARSAWATDETGESIFSVQAFWFAWAAFYPETLLYGESR